VYFANTMEALYYRYGFPDLGRVLANAVRWALGAPMELEVDAPDYVDVTHMGQPGRALVHLINLPLDKPLNTGWRHPGRNLVPVRNIKVRLRSQHDRQRVTSVQLASSGTALAPTFRDGACEVVVAELTDHEIVIFNFNKE
jgi:hypothetical protein